MTASKFLRQTMNDNATIHVMCRYYVLILITWPPDECTLLFCSIIEKIVVGGLHLLLDDVQKIINKRDRVYFLFKKFFSQRIFSRSCYLLFRTHEILIRVQVLCYLTLLSTYFFFQSWIYRVTNLTYHCLRKSNNYEHGLQPQISSLNQ